MIEITTIVAAASAISGTGVIGALYKVYVDRQKRVDTVLAAIRIEHQACSEALKASGNELQEIRLRVVVLEMKNDLGFPMWRKSQEGRYLWANPEYVRRVLAPLHLNINGIYGKTDDEIPEFSAELRSDLVRLDNEAAVRGFATMSHVPFHLKPGGSMTIIKRLATDELGGITFVGIACPESEGDL